MASIGFAGRVRRVGCGGTGVPTRVDDDSTFGNFRYTTPDNTAHAFDCKGYEYFVIGIEKPYQGDSAGTTAALEAMIV